MEIYRAVIFALPLAMGAIAFAQQTTREKGEDESRSRGEAEREIAALETRLNDAIVKADREFFDRVFADDFTHTNHAGVLRTKAQWMANHKFDAEKPAKSAYDTFDVDDLAVRVYGDTAVVTGRSTPKGRDSKGGAITGQYRFTRVWVKRQGRWQVVAFQGTRVASS
jgi:uncharacterized protein (TIGR02246 family)